MVLEEEEYEDHHEELHCIVHLWTLEPTTVMDGNCKNQGQGKEGTEESRGKNRATYGITCERVKIKGGGKRDTHYFLK